MRIIIVGCGKVGYSLAENLSQEDNDVTVVDRCPAPLQKAGDNLDVLCVRGNGASAKTLLEAGARDGDILIAATSGDELNMLCCLTAKKLGVKHAVARIRDPEYASELSLLRNDIGLDMVINPEQAAAGEIARLLKFPPAVDVEPFARGRVEMVELKITGDMAVVGLSLQEISTQISSSILIGAVLRGGEIFIPDGATQMLENDTVYLIGQPSSVYDFCRRIGVYYQKIKTVMILGGGRLSYYLAKYLGELKIKVKIIEINRERCLELTEVLPQALIICGDGSDDGLLQSENLGEMGAFVAATGRDEDNLISALFAKRSGVGKVVAKITRLNHPEIVQDMGIDSLVNPKQITTDLILKYARGLKNAVGNPMNTLYRIFGGKVEALEFNADSSAGFLDVPIRDLEIDRGILIAAIVRNNSIIIPHGNAVIRADDSVILIAKDKICTDLGDMILSGGTSVEL